MATVSLDDILRLSIEERIQIVQEVWDSIAASSEALPLTDAEREELDRRLDGQAASPGQGTPWEAARARLLERQLILSLLQRGEEEIKAGVGFDADDVFAEADAMLADEKH